MVVNTGKFGVWNVTARVWVRSFFGRGSDEVFDTLREAEDVRDAFARDFPEIVFEAHYVGSDGLPFISKPVVLGDDHGDH